MIERLGPWDSQNAASLASRPLVRLPLLLAVSCLGTGAALLGGRALLELRPSLSAASSSASLERERRWSPDPWRRREASLLLHQRAEGDLTRQARLLRGQAWGSDGLAAVVLKQQALNAEALDRPQQAVALWQQLQRRFPSEPPVADALYSLGRRTPALRQDLLNRFPAHPAALAAALEQGPAPGERLAGALHLARWGPRWPGAAARLKESCGNPGLQADQRAQLAAGLAELGDATAGIGCLKKGDNLPAAGFLGLARALLRGDDAEKRQALPLLVSAAQGPSSDPTAEEAVRLLAQQEGPEADAALKQLPAHWQDSAPVLAHRSLASGGQGAIELLRRWPGDPASWDLQWELARKRMLEGSWSDVQTLLSAIDPAQLPPALAARQRFWLGYSQRQLGQDEAATATWRELRLHHPGGYYGWRAAVQLGEGDLSLKPGGSLPSAAWTPLSSGDSALDRLWRLDQRTEAWEAWRHQRGNQPPRDSRELLLEGRLRQGVGDDWTGFSQLEQANLRLKPEECPLQAQLEQSLHPPRYSETFEKAAQNQGVPVALLLAVAKQESRFTPGVHSGAGAVGLLQLMPATAAELAGGPVAESELIDPKRNAELGSRYLKSLLNQGQDDPLLAVASYNAGPGAVQGWISPLVRSAPELWVEAIPFPETRLYVKKVLGNAWSYLQPRPPQC